MAEMWTRSPIMQGNTEQHQLTLISQLCGSITPEVRAGARAGRGGQELRCGGVRWGWDRVLLILSLPCTRVAACFQHQRACCWRGGWELSIL